MKYSGTLPYFQTFEERVRSQKEKWDMRYAIWDVGEKSFYRISQISHRTSS